MKQLFVLIAIFVVKINSQIICDPVIHSFHPNPYKCDRFILCFFGNEIDRTCAPGLHYDQTTTQCMEPERANCVVEIQPNCQSPDNPNEIIFIASQTDCTRFFVCHNGIAIMRQCATGLFYDINDEWCTFPEGVTCHPNVSNNPNAVTTTTANPNIFECPNTSGTSFHPHSTDCSRFFICINGESFVAFFGS